MGGVLAAARLLIFCAKLAVFAAFLSILGASAALAQSTLTKEAFLKSEGAAAFKAGDYAGAAAGFEKLLKKYPQNPTIIRYVGLSRYRLRDFASAIRWYERGLRVAPNDAALQFFAAKAYLAAGDEQTALARLLAVTRLGAGSIYAQKASAELAQRDIDIKGRVAERLPAAPKPAARPPAPRKDWSLFLQAGVEYDDNVLAAPDDFAGDTDDYRAFQNVLGRYRFYQSGGVSLEADAGGYFSQHLDDFDEFDLTSLKAGLTAKLRRSIGGAPTLFSLRYGYDYDLLSGDAFSGAHEATARVAVAPNSRVTLTAQYAARLVDFDQDGVDPPITSRDAVNHQWEARGYLYAPSRDYYGWLGYRYDWNDADGRNFESEGHSALAGAVAALPYRFRIDGQASVSRVRYENFVSPVRRETERLSLKLGLQRPIWDDLTARLGYSYINEDSTIGVLEYDRQIVTFSLTQEF